jgi:hypothetical protein
MAQPRHCQDVVTTPLLDVCRHVTLLVTIIPMRPITRDIIRLLRMAITLDKDVTMDRLESGCSDFLQLTPAIGLFHRLDGFKELYLVEDE